MEENIKNVKSAPKKSEPQDKAQIKKLEKELFNANARAEEANRKIEELANKFDLVSQMLQNNTVQNTQPQVVQYQPQQPIIVRTEAAKADPESPDRFITIVNLKEYYKGTGCFIKTRDKVLKMSQVGEIIRVRLAELSFIKSTHQKMFDKGLIALSDKDTDIAESYGLPTATKELEKSKRIAKIGELSAQELKEFYKEANHALREMILARFVVESADNNPKFKDLEKVSVLNALSKGGLEVLYTKLLEEPENK